MKTQNLKYFSKEAFEATSAALMILSQDGEILDLNQAAVEITGYQAQELEGQYFWKVFFQEEQKTLAQSYFEKAKTSPFFATYDTPWVTKSGGVRHATLNLCAYSKSARSRYLMLTVTDLTESRDMESELWKHRTKMGDEVRLQTNEIMDLQKKLSGILNGTEEAIISVDPQQNILLFNQGAERAFGYSSSEVLGQPLSVLIPERYQDNHTQLVQNFGRSEIGHQCTSDRSDIYGRHKDGTEFQVEANISQAEIDGTKIFTAILRDISAKKRIERRLQESLAEKEVLLREIHHRVKNNLQIISSLFMLQARRVGDQEVLNILKDSQHRIQSMALIHEKIYESEGLTQVGFDRYIHELVADIRDSYHQDAYRVTLEFSLDPVKLDIDTAIPCALILNELVSNSLKHAFVGRTEGTLSIDLRYLEKNQLLLSVRDDGIGLPESFSLQNQKSLGIRLVSMLIRQLHGELSMSLESGTCFEIKFPPTKVEA
jgi:PAS domain S-box-containing protein